jgi:hypothetical protein
MNKIYLPNGLVDARATMKPVFKIISPLREGRHCYSDARKDGRSLKIQGWGLLQYEAAVILLQAQGVTARVSVANRRPRLHVDF